MNTSNTGAGWIPYIIPPCPSVPPNDLYALSFENENAVPTKNPSQFLRWKQVSLPQGTNLGDMLYWDPSAGAENEGAWVVLPSPSGGGLKVLTIEGRQLSWKDTEDCD